MDKIKGNTDLYALIGYPISHSYSPQIHNFLFKRFELNSVYVAFNSKFNKKEFFYFIECLSKIDNFKGANITIPYKEWACEYTENDFKSLGAINCIKFKNGKIFATNTDIYGFKVSLEKYLNFSAKNKNILIFGAGSTAKSIIYSIVKDVNKIFVVNRSIERAEMLKRSFQEFKKIYLNKPDNFNDIDLVINTTPVGLHGEKLNIDYKKFKKECCFFDVLYVDTPFVKDALKNGYKAVNGLNMLIYQAVKSFEFWTGYDVDERIVKEIKKGVFLATD